MSQSHVDLTLSNSELIQSRIMDQINVNVTSYNSEST